MREDTAKVIKEYKIKTLGMKKGLELLETRIPQTEEIVFISFANITWPNPEFPARPTLATGNIAIARNNLYVNSVELTNVNNKVEKTLPLTGLQAISCNATGFSGAQFKFVFKECSFLAAVGFYQKALAEKLFKLILNLNKDLVINMAIDPGASAAAAVPDMGNIPIADAIGKAVAENIKGAGEADATEELRKFKALLDDGVITREEFEAKKKQLLNI